MADEVAKAENPSQEELYTKLETEKLVKSKKKKRIATLVSLCFFFALAVVIIVLATVPVSLKPSFVSNDFERVDFYTNSSTSAVGTVIKGQPQHKTRYNNFLKLFDESFAQSYISAIFSGSFGSYDLSDGEKYLAFDNALTELSSTKYIDIKYSSSKVLTNQNGSEYLGRYTTSNEPLTFDEIYIVVNEKNGFQETKVYLCVDYPSGLSDRLITLTVRANTYKIFEEWDKFVG